MESKVYLEQIRDLETQINLKLLQVNAMKESLQRLTPAYKEKTGSGGKIAGDTLGITVAKIVDAENDIDKDVDNLIALQIEATKKINQIKDHTLAKLLTSRYVSLKTWNEVAYEIGYSKRRIFELHGIALKKLDLVLENEIPH